mmetsp:Transcript_11021/g.23744  ORF Transcript_11021/g.23744 Transcript_11021/m.23744 type:complete len:789 (-) Transcript_11021:4-2370(-)
MEQLTQPPPTNPFGSDRGTALDVIVVVPPPPLIAPKRRRRNGLNESQETDLSTSLESSCNNRKSVVSSDSLQSKYDGKNISSSQTNPPASLIKSALKQEQPAKGVIASSDFYVSFPSSALSFSAPSNSTASASFLSISKSKKLRSFFSRNSSLSGSSIDSAADGGNKSSDAETAKNGRDDDAGSSCADGNKEAELQKTQPPIKNTAKQQITSNRKSNVQIQINGRYIPELDMIFSKKGGGNGSDAADSTSCRFVNGNGLRPPTETLYMLIGKEIGLAGLEENSPSCGPQQYPGSNTNITQILNYGRNLIRYTLVDKVGSIAATAEAYLYLWSACDSIIVCDVDGTVTKSDVRGVIDSVIQDKFQHIHAGICKFFHDLLAFRSVKEKDNTETLDEGYDEDGRDVTLHKYEEKPSTSKHMGEIRFLYLSSRPISIISQTRKLLVSVSQIHLGNTSLAGDSALNVNDDPSAKRYSLPPGPILCHTGSLSSVLFAELVAKNVFEFKADVLARQVVLPFVAARGEEWKYMIRNLDDRGDADDGGESQLHDNQEKSSKGCKSSFQWDDRLFLAGFGNKVTDAMGYEMAGMDRRDIYIINKDSRIMCMENDALSERGVSDSELSRINQLSGSSGSAFDDIEWSPDASCCMGEDSLLALKQSGSCNGSIDHMHHSDCDFLSDDHEIELCLSEEPQDMTSDDTSFANHHVDVCISPKAQRMSRIVTDNKESTKKLKKNTSRRSIKQSIRAFSSKKSFNKFPSFTSTSSNEQTTSQKEFYEGYSDARLLHAVSKRMIR